MQESQKIFIIISFSTGELRKNPVCTIIIRSSFPTSTAQTDQIRGKKLINKLVKSSHEFVIKVDTF